MIDLDDDLTFILESNCTVEVAVMKLLGWMRGRYRHKTLVFSDEITLKELSVLANFDDRLDPFLDRRRAVRLHEFEDVCNDENATEEMIFEKRDALDEWDAITSKAVSYSQDIVDEIAKGENSALRIDQFSTGQSGEMQITMKSFGLWAKSEYGISIDDPTAYDSKVLKPPPSACPEGDDPKFGLSKVKAEHLYTTLAFAVNAVALAEGDFRKSDGKANVNLIAQHLSVLAKQGKEELQGQRAVAIRKRIATALRIMERKCRDR